METFVASFFLVAASEMGDKTQLLTFWLAARFKKPWAILAGIFFATILNHFLASTAGSWLVVHLSPRLTSGFLSGLFLIFALWTLKSDALGEPKQSNRYGAFATTTFLFFLAEMGDKTQFATMALAARSHSIWEVTAASTLGILVTDGLAVFLGDKLSTKVNYKYLRWLACFFFILLSGISFYEFLSLPS